MSVENVWNCSTHNVNLAKKGAQSAFHIAVIKEMESLLAQLHLLHTAAWPSL